MAVGIVVSSFYREEMDITVGANEPFTFGNYTLEHTGIEFYENETRERTAAPLIVRDSGGRELARMSPARDFYFKVPGGQVESEVAVRSFGMEDLYIVFTGPDLENETVTYKLFSEPLISLVWLGGFILILGSFIVVWPDPREERILERVRTRDAVRVMP
jgi:cytochrome c-type biogenesis protein CcmF